MENTSSRLDEALKLLNAGDAEKCLKIASLELDEDPQNLIATWLSGKAFLDMRRPGLADIVISRAIELNPKDPLLWSYLGIAYNMSYRPDLAMEALRRALEFSPRYQLALDAMSLVFVNKGDPNRAVEWVNKAMAIKEDIRDKHGLTTLDVLQHAGFAYLMRGDYKEGWPLFNTGLGNDASRRERVYGTEKKWDGTKGLTVVAFGEQGIGDELAFASAIPDFIKDCNAIIECDHRLEGLFKRSFDCPVYGTRYRSADWSKDIKVDAHISLAQLMEFYRNSKEDFPGTAYLKPDPEKRKWWRAILDQYPGKKIGITWNGGDTYTGHRKRSVELEDLLQLRGNDTFVSLEYKDPGDCGVLNFHKQLDQKNYDDTAALVAELDHVISVTTAIVDLCGAIGKSCDVLVPTIPPWRYGLKGDMPWYKSVRLFRQLPNEPWSKTIRRYARLHRS
jgi:tetratricopeptide (TPR) repeat protein